MNEEGDNPTVSGEVQPTSMESLNDELTSKTDKPHQALESGHNIQHEIRRFQKFLTMSAQVIRLHWIPILISSIICFVFRSDIAETSLPRNLFALFFNAFAILLMFKLIKGQDKGKRESAVKMSDMENDNKLMTEKLESLQSPDVTIHAKFIGISKLSFVEYFYSQPTEINGITWKTRLYKGYMYKRESLFHLYAENENAVNWYCPLIAEFRLISQKSNAIVLREERKLTFHAEASSHCIQSISFEDMFDGEKGYVTDDSITFDVVIRFLPANHLEKLEAELKSQMSLLIKQNSEMYGDVQRILEKVEKVETNSRLLSSLHDQTSGAISCGFEKVDKNLRSILDRTNEITLRARFTDISKLTEEGVYSQWTEYAGFSWRVLLKKDDGHLEIYLKQKKFDDEDKWSCAVLAEFQLLSQKDNSIVECHQFEKPRVNDESKCWGFCLKKITFEDLLKGDAVRDDSIIVAVVARVFPTN